MIGNERGMLQQELLWSSLLLRGRKLLYDAGRRPNVLSIRADLLGSGDESLLLPAGSRLRGGPVLWGGGSLRQRYVPAGPVGCCLKSRSGFRSEC